MSAIAAVWEREHGAAGARPARLERMMRAQAYRGPDGAGTHVDAARGLALGQLALHTTPEDHHARLPLGGEGGLWLTVAGRLDNRPELIDLLGRSVGEAAAEGVSDAALMLAAYRRWGEGGFRRLVGDFACVLWDGRHEVLYCVVDALGIGNLYYAEDHACFIGATTIGGVIAGLGTTPPPHEPMIASFLLHDFSRGRCDTFYRGIQRLRGGWLLRVTRTAVEARRYYRLGELDPPPLRHDADWIAHFRELLTQAVAARLRSDRPLALQVSGGMDSSSVACIAHRLWQRGEIAARATPTLRASIAPGIPELDEWSWQQAVLDRCVGLPRLLVDARALWALRFRGWDEGYPNHQPEPHPQRTWCQGMLQAARERGHRVVIHANVADFVLGASWGYWRGELWRELGDPRLALAELPHFVRHRSLGNTAYGALLRPALRRSFPGLVGARRLLRGWRRAPWVDPWWALAQRPRMTLGDEAPAQLGRAARLTYDWLTGGWTALWHASYDALAGWLGMQWRDPYADRRLVDFMLRVPTRLLVRGGRHKHLLREALLGLLPEPVRLRYQKTDVTRTVELGLRERERAALSGWIEGSRAAAQGWVHLPIARRAWRRYQLGAVDDYQPLVDLLNLEGWLRAPADVFDEAGQRAAVPRAPVVEGEP